MEIKPAPYKGMKEDPLPNGAVSTSQGREMPLQAWENSSTTGILSTCSPATETQLSMDLAKLMLTVRAADSNLIPLLTPVANTAELVSNNSAQE